MYQFEIEGINEIALTAGEAILNIYQNSENSDYTKSDGSAVTDADLASHKIIYEKLKKLTPNIPIISEESSSPSWSERRELGRYWLVDPLGGTKEFLKRNGEFTVNIALIEGNCAVLGVVYAPEKRMLYYGEKGKGAFKVVDGQKPDQIFVSKSKKMNDRWQIVGSSSHHSEGFDRFVSQFAQKNIIQMGSSLKFCLVAEGAADIYPRLGPTSEWDTAASQAIVEAAGGQVIGLNTLKPLQYNAKESLLNPDFVVCAEPLPDWKFLYSKDVFWFSVEVDKKARAERYKQKPSIIWFTGLSGSGKSTSANLLEKKLFSYGFNTYLLDGDNVRHGLCSDLGFSEDQRSENIRRVGEVAKLMIDAGLIVIASFISPFERERKMIRNMVKEGEFIEVYVNTPIHICESRDPKGLYRKARQGKIENFTGVDSPYETPVDHEIELNTASYEKEEIADYLIDQLVKCNVIKI